MHKRLKTYVLIGVALILLVATGSILLGFRQDMRGKTTQKNDTIAAVDTVVQPNSASAKIQVKLPNATPIDARIEDYNLPSSLWAVVSKDYPLTDQQYRPTDITRTDLPSRSDKSEDEQSVRAIIVSDLTAMFADAKAAGHDVMIASGFRSYDLQQTYFNSYSRSYGEEAASKFSARPGQSEHQTGLSLDIAYTNRDCYLDTCFGDKPAGKWLAANAYTYGFVLRYPADKTEITRYQYEPWHFRYVGKPLATVLHESGLTLDEARPYLQEALTQLRVQHKI